MRGKPRTYEECHKIVDGITYKLCSDCNEWLPMNKEYFYKNKSANDGFNPYCKKDTIKRTVKYREDNPEWLKNYGKEKYQNKQEYYKDKAKRWNKENEDRAKEIQKEWRQDHPEIVKGYNEDRKLHKKHTISKNEWENCKNYFNYRCAYCELPIEEHYVQYKGEVFIGDFHKEHVDDCGENDLSNCIPSCKSCNTSKHTYKLDEWYNENDLAFTIERLNKIIKWLSKDYKKFIKKH
jgi:hypothetical protein